MCKAHNLVRTKSIVKGQMLDKITKRIAYKISLFIFRQRLKYKCDTYNILYKDINEAYTTKTCSNCSTINNVGLSRTYKCLKCNILLGRDINAARNIMLL